MLPLATLAYAGHWPFQILILPYIYCFHCHYAAILMPLYVAIDDTLDITP